MTWNSSENDRHGARRDRRSSCGSRIAKAWGSEVDLHGANSGRLYRDGKDRVILGVCAGIARYFGINPWVVRILAILGLLMFTPPTIIGYIIFALVLPKAPERLYRTPDEERFWTEVRVDPARSSSELRHRFRELDHRLRRMESYVTSEAYRVDREIRDLER